MFSRAALPRVGGAPVPASWVAGRGVGCPGELAPPPVSPPCGFGRYRLGPPSSSFCAFVSSVKGKYKLHLHIMEYFEKNVVHCKRFKTAWHVDFSRYY